MVVGVYAMSACFWWSEGLCRHPKIGGGDAPESRCSECNSMKLVGVTVERTAPHKQGLVAKGLSWVKAEASLLSCGPVAHDVLVARLETCNACTKLKRVDEEGKLGYCTRCGCGENRRSELTVKATMPLAKCPLALWDLPDSPKLPLPLGFIESLK
jgi:hypothetical protein